MLVVKDKKTSSYAATFVESKGATEYSTRFMTGFIRGLGWKRLSFKSDNEPALLALKKRVVESSQDIEMVPLESPVGDHAANGDAEEAVKKIKQQIRKMKGSLEDFFGEYLDPSLPLIAWLPRHAAQGRLRSRSDESAPPMTRACTRDHWRPRRRAPQRRTAPETCRLIRSTFPYR